MMLHTIHVLQIIGLFAMKEMNYSTRIRPTEPTLPEMTRKAIRILKEQDKRDGQNGFLLFVEGGLIDFAHHANWAAVALNDTLEFDQAVQVAMDETSDNEDTLILVTADHSHVFDIAGYPLWTANLFGFFANSHFLS